MLFLTPQPFQPKLRLTKHMRAKTQRIRIFALLLGIIFLGAQFHSCTDLTAAPSASHVCPVCSTSGSAIATSSPNVEILLVLGLLFVAHFDLSVSSAVPRATSPRAPPVL